MRGGRCEKSGMRKGTWTPDEDKKLVDYVTRYGHWNWCLLPKFAGLERCGKSCRLRWVNYLRPNLKRGNYTQQEEETIVKLQGRLGNRWSTIAAEMPGRTDNEIKNHWHTKLKKRIQHHNVDSVKESEVSVPKDQDQLDQEPITTTSNNIDNSSSTTASQLINNHDSSSSSSIIMSTEHSNDLVNNNNIVGMQD